MKIPKTLLNLTQSFQKLPGIGPKTAQRLSYYLLHVPQSELDGFSESLVNLKKNTILCSVCKNVSEEDPCEICTNTMRDKTQVLVVEQPLDVLAFEKTGRFKGVYHVLHGRISPLENIGPDEIFLEDLFARVVGETNSADKITEVIVATNPTMEGDATAMYITRKLKEKDGKVKITRLGMGIPTGADLEYADEVTLTQSLEGRRQM